MDIPFLFLGSSKEKTMSTLTKLWMINRRKWKSNNSRRKQ